MRQHYMYARRRRRRPGIFLIYVFLSALFLLVLGGVGYGVYNLLNGTGFVPTVAIPLGPPTATPRPTATPIPMLAGVITDAYTGKPLSGISITIGTEDLTTDRDGAFQMPRPQSQTDLTVALPDYERITRQVGPSTSQALALALRPTRLEGIVQGSDGQPLADATVSVGATKTTTETDGHYVLENVPANATLIVEAPDHARFQEAIGQRTSIEVKLRKNILSGLVKSKDGQPIAKATVALGSKHALTGPDGRFRLDGLESDGMLAVKAPGYKAEKQQTQVGSSVEITLTPFTVKAIYLTHLTAADAERFDALLALVKRTELNAMILDVKGESGQLFYESALPLAKEIGAVEPAYDVKKRLKQLHDAGVYVIARQVIMEDTLLASKRPEWAVKNTATGEGWKDVNGIGWLNPFQPEVAEYNAAIAKELAELGFDEVQFDYVRFPSDGALGEIDYGQEATPETRTAAIAKLLIPTRDALASYGVYFAADVFGLTTVAHDDLGIGQEIEAINDALDYICPMVYPSHYARGEFGFKNPASMPYEVVNLSLQGGAPKLGDGRAQYRPWLQDFDLYGTPYSPQMVRAQITASEENKTSGWMIWNAANKYQEAALRPENG